MTHSHTSPHQHTHADAPHTEGMLIRWARSYDAVVQALTLGQARRLRRRTADLLRLAPNSAVLDVGCGTGDLAFEIARRLGPDGTIIGIDAAPEMIARAQHKAQRRHSPAQFQLAVAESLPFADHTFDHIVTSLVMHHLPGDLKARALAEMARVVKPGGTITIVDFMPPAGTAQQHAVTSSAAQPLADLLHAVGCTSITSGPMPIRSLGRLLGWPPMGYVQGIVTGG